MSNFNLSETDNGYNCDREPCLRGGCVGEKHWVDLYHTPTGNVFNRYYCEKAIEDQREEPDWVVQ